MIRKKNPMENKPPPRYTGHLAKKNPRILTAQNCVLRPTENGVKKKTKTATTW